MLPVIFVVTLVTSYLGTLALTKWAVKFGLVDIPKERSSHCKPTPCSGGIAIFISFMVSMSFLYFYDQSIFTNVHYWGVVLGLILVSGISFIDDLRDIPAIYRLIVQLGAALILVSLGIKLNRLSLPIFGNMALGGFSIPITLLWIVGVTNIYNFMDGIDGLAAGEGFLVSIFLAIIASMCGNQFVLVTSIVLAGGSLGFLVHNFAPAKIFMGDIGSTFLGFSFASLAIIGQQSEASSIPFLVCVLLLGTFLFDTMTTLSRRIIRKEKWFAAHRSHYYQRLSILGYGHKQISCFYYVLTIALGISAILQLKLNDLLSAMILLTCILLLLSIPLTVNILERRQLRSGSCSDGQN